MSRDSPLFGHSYVDVPKSYQQAVRIAHSRVLASHRGGPGSLPGRDMSVLGPLV
jgi:hypothetical protein